jgi:hypothetical protein
MNFLGYFYDGDFMEDYGQSNKEQFFVPSHLVVDIINQKIIFLHNDIEIQEKQIQEIGEPGCDIVELKIEEISNGEK